MSMSIRWLSRSDRGVAIAGLCVIVVWIGAVFVILGTTSYDIAGAALIGPVLILVSIPALLREARRQADPTVFRLLLIALVVKLLASLLRYFVDFHVYGGATDALGYHHAGIRWSHALSVGASGSQGQGLTGTNFIELVTGIVYVITRPTLLGGYLVFSWLAYWGLFFFYRAFVIAVPEGRSRTYARFVLFFPSLLFWPSGLGKEAWMIFTLGIASFGVARLFAGQTRRGIGALALGLWLAALARPHVAAILAISLLAAGSVSLLAKRTRSISFGQKMAILAMAGGVSFLLVVSTRAYFKASSVSTDDGVLSTLTQIEDRTAQGGSEFEPFVVDSPTVFPAAAVTVLFRPFLIEANSAQAVATAIEGGILALICVSRWRWALAALSSVLRQPYVLFALVFTAAFVVVFSSIANFGILARERVQVIPFFLIAFSIPPRASSRSAEFALEGSDQHATHGASD
jgi:hypothetical protein